MQKYALPQAFRDSVIAVGSFYLETQSVKFVSKSKNKERIYAKQKYGILRRRARAGRGSSGFDERRDRTRAESPGELAERLREHHSTSPADSGGDIDAEWEDANDSGAESFGGHNPTPDQSDVEENAHAMGINFEDNEPLDLEKIDKRDRDRYEMKEGSKGRSDSI